MLFYLDAHNLLLYEKYVRSKVQSAQLAGFYAGTFIFIVQSRIGNASTYLKKQFQTLNLLIYMY